LIKAIKTLPKSIKIWTYAINREKNKDTKKKIIKKALE
jgi:hypothetical protein